MPNNLASTISLLNRDCLGKQLSTKIPFSKHNISFCSFLFRHGWISGYSIELCNIINVTHKFNNNRNIIFRYYLKSRPSYRYFCNYEDLLFLCRNTKHNSYYILRTSHGFLSSDEALLKRIGGELLCQLYF